MPIAPQTLFAAVKSLPQPTIHSITDAPGKVIVHVRIPNVQMGAPYTESCIHPVDHQQSEDLSRGGDESRIDLYRAHRYRRGRELEDQADRGVYRLQSTSRLYSGGCSGKSQETVVSSACLMTPVRIQQCLLRSTLKVFPKTAYIHILRQQSTRHRA